MNEVNEMKNLLGELTTYYVEGLPSISLKVRYHKNRNKKINSKSKWTAIEDIKFIGEYCPDSML